MCREFGIRWSEYSSLTCREHRVLVGILQAEYDRADAGRLANDRIGDAAAPAVRTAADGSRMERVC